MVDCCWNGERRLLECRDQGQVVWLSSAFDPRWPPCGSSALPEGGPLDLGCRWVSARQDEVICECWDPATGERTGWRGSYREYEAMGARNPCIGGTFVPMGPFGPPPGPPPAPPAIPPAPLAPPGQPPIDIVPIPGQTVQPPTPWQSPGGVVPAPGIFLPEGSILPGGAILPDGRRIPPGPVGAGGLFLPEGTILPGGVILGRGAPPSRLAAIGKGAGLLALLGVGIYAALQ